MGYLGAIWCLKRANYKHQITNNKQYPNFNFQKGKISLEFGSLYFEICLYFEFCYLGFNWLFLTIRKIYKANPSFVNYIKDTTIASYPINDAFSPTKGL